MRIIFNALRFTLGLAILYTCFRVIFWVLILLFMVVIHVADPLNSWQSFVVVDSRSLVVFWVLIFSFCLMAIAMYPLSDLIVRFIFPKRG